MNPLKSLETTIASLVEGGFGRLFRSEVRPIELARKLARGADPQSAVARMHRSAHLAEKIGFGSAGAQRNRILRGKRARAPQALRERTARDERQRFGALGGAPAPQEPLLRARKQARQVASLSYRFDLAMQPCVKRQHVGTCPHLLPGAHGCARMRKTQRLGALPGRHDERA